MSGFATVCFLVVLFLGAQAIGRDQATGAFGKLTCNGTPAAGVVSFKHLNEDSLINL